MVIVGVTFESISYVVARVVAGSEKAHPGRSRRIGLPQRVNEKSVRLHMIQVSEKEIVSVTGRQRRYVGDLWVQSQSPYATIASVRPSCRTEPPFPINGRRVPR